MFRKGWPRHIQEAQPSAITYVRCAVSISCWLIQRQEHQLQVEWERSRIDSVDDVYTELSVAAAVANVYESDSWPGYDNYEDQSQEDNNTKWIVMLYMVRHPLSLCLLLSSSCVLPFYLNWIYWLTQFQRYNWFNGFFIQMIRAAVKSGAVESNSVIMFPFVRQILKLAQTLFHSNERMRLDYYSIWVNESINR